VFDLAGVYVPVCVDQAVLSGEGAVEVVLERGEEPVVRLCGGCSTDGPATATPTSRKRWVTARNFGPYNPARQDKWVYGDRDSGAYLHKFAWTPIVRHAPVKGAASPDDPALAHYWADRRRKQNPRRWPRP
jgi:hypothetical protein